MQTFDAFGVPVFYVTVTIPEPAGGGNVRIWNCCDSAGILVTQCEIIIPAINLVVAARRIAEAAQEGFQRRNGVWNGSLNADLRQHHRQYFVALNQIGTQLCERGTRVP